MRVKDIPQIDKLSIPEKILLVEDLWDNIYQQNLKFRVPQGHISELDKRLESISLIPENFYLLMNLGKE